MEDGKVAATNKLKAGKIHQTYYDPNHDLDNTETEAHKGVVQPLERLGRKPRMTTLHVCLGK